MNKPVILLDIDGVIIDFVGPICRYFGCQEPRYWDLRDLGLDKGEIDSLVCRRDFCTELDPYHAALDFLIDLREIGRVVAVTSPYDRSRYWASERYHVLRSLGFAKQDIIIGKDKSLIWGDVLIDDCPENVSSFVGSNPERSGLLLDRPWNRIPDGADPWPPEWCRVRDYDHCLHVVRNIVTPVRVALP